MKENELESRYEIMFNSLYRWGLETLETNQYKQLHYIADDIYLPIRNYPILSSVVLEKVHDRSGVGSEPNLNMMLIFGENTDEVIGIKYQLNRSRDSLHYLNSLIVIEMGRKVFRETIQDPVFSDTLVLEFNLRQNIIRDADETSILNMLNRISYNCENTGAAFIEGILETPEIGNALSKLVLKGLKDEIVKLCERIRLTRRDLHVVHSASEDELLALKVNEDLSMLRQKYMLYINERLALGHQFETTRSSIVEEILGPELLSDVIDVYSSL